MTDPIADYLTRIRNGIMAKHRVVDIPASNMKRDITKILFDKGYILNYKFEDKGYNELFNWSPLQINLVDAMRCLTKVMQKYLDDHVWTLF